MSQSGQSSLLSGTQEQNPLFKGRRTFESRLAFNRFQLFLKNCTVRTKINSMNSRGTVIAGVESSGGVRSAIQNVENDTFTSLEQVVSYLQGVEDDDKYLAQTEVLERMTKFHDREWRDDRRGFRVRETKRRLSEVYF